MNTSQIKSILSWLDDHILLLLSGFLLVFIPLFPKIPLFSPIEQYIVRIRLEDLFVFGTSIIWFIQVLRKKISWKLPISLVIVAYAITGAISLITAVFVINTIPLQPLHLGKSLLHYFRYLEYFSLFFILGTATRTKAHVRLLILIITTTLLCVGLYGIGQKYYYWPVYSTMNREFSKGIQLYLTEHARVQSTFAGHYDLGAYLVVVLPLVLGAFFTTSRKLLKLLIGTSFVLGLWLLVVSASRTSFVAAMIGVTILLLAQSLHQKTLWKKASWAISRLFFVYFIFSFLVFRFGDDIRERLLQAVDTDRQIRTAYIELNNDRKEYFKQLMTQITGRENQTIVIIPKAQPPAGGVASDENGPIISSDTRPTPARPEDVYVDVPDLVEIATISATGQSTTILVQRDRVFSDCANEKGLSLCIRLETLWPKAIAGFMSDPLFGKGYATLNKDGVTQFTEAESTDNNFLRTLGETGLVGFITFYGVIAAGVWYALKHYIKTDNFGKTLIVSYVAASLGLLLNAVYIDVFAASKVAFMYWALTGIVVGYFHLEPAAETAPATHSALLKKRIKK